MSSSDDYITTAADLVGTPPMSTSDAVEWINDARVALELAADIIEHLLRKRDELDEACEALATLNGILIDHANFEHLPGCDQDERAWINTERFDCRGCELMALIRFVNDYEQLPDWPNSGYVTAARNAHIPNLN